MAMWTGNTAGAYPVDGVTWTPMVDTYRCHVCLIPERGGGFSAIVLNLPGCGSCGDTEEEALANVQEAIRGVIESYREDVAEIPWKDSTRQRSPGRAKAKWIVVSM